MKRLVLAITALLIVHSSSSAYQPPPGSGGVSFGVFYSSLSPYGEWISVGGDMYAWRPTNVATGWRPYTEGHWAWTDDGWYWISDEPWGWASYHYGRWYYDDYYGWLWMPGYDWAPAWVEWRYGGDYIGWAPLGPYAVFNINFGIHYRTRWVTPIHYWSFVDCGYITNQHLHKYMYRPENNTRYIGRTRTIGSVRYNGGRIITRGPERSDVERRGQIKVERVEVMDVADRQAERVVRSGDHERIETYRPKIEDRSTGSAIDRPERVRESEKSIPLDTKSIDVRARSQERESGRDIRRAEEYKKQRETVRSDGSKAETGQDHGANRRSDQSVRKEKGREQKANPAVHQKEPQPERKKESVERKWPRREESVDRSRDSRSKNPERTVRRSETRSPDQPHDGKRK